MTCAAKTCTSTIIATPPSVDWPWPDWFRDIAPSLARLWDRQRQRQALLELDDRLLQDIGVSREEARREGKKPFWR